MHSRKRIVVIGAGNVASHLAPALAKHADIVQVCAATYAHARDLCRQLGAGEPMSNPADVVCDADCYLICVKDADIQGVAAAMPHVCGVVAHTSGSVQADVLRCASRHYGVLYPLQTFSRDVHVDVGDVPFFTEASDADTLCLLDNLASSMSRRTPVHLASSQRAKLHLAGVFACNFCNLMWGAADNIMHDIGCNLGDLEPLVRTTLAKAIANNPADVQTGPASRGDTAVMQRQEAALESPWNHIYALLSLAIAERKLNQPILKQ